VTAIDRLKALDEAGIDLSRNRHFEFFESPENRRALSLDHYLDALAGELREGANHASLTLTLAPDEHGRLALGVGRNDLSMHHTAHLSPEEFDELAGRDGVAQILAKQGIDWT